METVYSMRPVLAILTSLTCAALIPIMGKRHRNMREFLTLSAAVSKWIIIMSMYPLVVGGGVYIYKFREVLPGLALNFRVDAFSMFFSALSASLWIFTSIYSIGYMRTLHERAQTRYYFAFAICVASTVGIAHADDLFTMFIFYEILTIATYPLVIHEETPEALAAGRKYLAYTLTGGAFILFGMVYTYHLAGSLTFANQGFLAGHASSQMLKLLFMIFMIGFGVKAAIMPLHGWLPAAMVAPTPVSALLHAVAVVKAGIFGITRVVCNVYGMDLMRELNLGTYLAWVAVFTIIVGSLLAMMQDNLKMRLAYSTISQLSYIVLGLALLTPSGWTGGILHIAHQAFMKITLFFCAGAIYVQTGKTKISEMNGIGRSMPITMGAFALCGLGMAGTPPMAGFISKWYLSMGALEGGNPIFVVILLMSGLMNLMYFVPPAYNAFFGHTDEVLERNEASLWLLVPIVYSALMALVLGIVPLAPYTPMHLAMTAVNEFMGVL